MKVVFSAPQKLGNKPYKAGEQEIPDSLAHNRAFQALVLSGAVRVQPRDIAAQKIQMSRDAKAFQQAKASRKARKASRFAAAQAKASDPSAPAAPGAQGIPSSGASKAVQPIQSSVKPTSAAASPGVAASAPKASG